MFTGIIEEVGRVRSAVSGHSGGRIEISADKVLFNTQIGDSIAVNGICLTVTSMKKDRFTADVMPETMKRSNLGKLRPGDAVNLERAMPADGRFGGHIVSGHVDGTGTIDSFVQDENAVRVRIAAAHDILQLIVEKGSIAIDGISLTVTDVTATDFGVSVIPHTGSETTLLGKKKGDTVNLENDIVGKYVKRLLEQGASDTLTEESGGGITMDYLSEHGFA